MDNQQPMSMEAILSALQSQLGQAQQTQSGLQQRLNQIDQFAGSVNPMVEQNIANVAQGENRPYGLNPLTAVEQRLAVGSGIAGERNRAMGDSVTAQNVVLSLLNQLYGAQKDKRDFGYKQEQDARDFSYKQEQDKLNLITDKSPSALTIDDNGNLVIGQSGQASDGERDPAIEQYVRDVEEGKMKMSNVPPNAREAVAARRRERILNKEVDPQSMMSKEEADKYSKVVNSISNLDLAQTYFPEGTKNQTRGKDNLTGIAVSQETLIGKLNKFFSENTGKDIKKRVEAQSAIGSYSSDKIKELSGAAVSVQEAARLSTFLPTSTDGEATVATKLDALNRWFQLQEEVLVESTILEMSPEAYYRKNQKELFAQFGFDASGQGMKKSTMQESTSDFDPNYFLDRHGKYGTQR